MTELSKFELRRAKPADALILAELSRRTFFETFASYNTPENMKLYSDATFGEELQLREIQDPNRIVELAFMDGGPAGFFQLRMGSAPHAVKGQNSIELLRLYVESKWHGCGLGPRLLEKAFQQSFEAGFTTIWLGVWESNQRAKAFYSKLGFEVQGYQDFKLGHELQRDLIMVRSIPPKGGSR